LSAQADSLRRLVARRDAVLLALTFCAGSMDAISYLGMGGVFVGMMTGNLVILGFSIGTLSTGHIIQSLVSMAGFVVGVGIGELIVGPGRVFVPWPPRATVGIGIELVLITTFAAGWMAFGGGPDGIVQHLLLATASTGMGMQTAVSRSLVRSSAPPTGVTGNPFVTSTLAGMASHLFSGLAFRWVPHAVALVALIAGAATGAVLLERVPLLAPLGTLTVLTAAVLAAAFTLNHDEGEFPGS
jgi:uncharacterized membrane protein YoaK (UPF0700 family)